VNTAEFNYMFITMRLGKLSLISMVLFF